MLRLRAFGLCAILFLLLSCPGGCVQRGGHTDAERDPHFERGRSLADGQDFKQAAQEFEKALETNPRSAPAHFELGWLYETKLNDYAAAIYHYDRLLQLQPESQRAALIKDRIRGCKQQLANIEFPLPHSRDLQKELDRLSAENSALKQQLESFKTQAAAARVEPSPAHVVTARPEPLRLAVAPAAPSHARVHVIKSHETITSIAAEYGVKPGAILAANPQTDPRRLRIGQSLNLP